MCLPCTESQELSGGNITKKSKAKKGIRRDAVIAAAAKYKSLYSNVDSSCRAQAKALAVVTTNFTFKLAAIQAKILDMTSRHVSLLPARGVVIWFFMREESHH